MAKNLQIGVLNELYGALLTERQYEAVKAYYDYDLSLGEIAENLGVTRQAVRDAIAKGEAALSEFEHKLGFLQKTVEVKATLDMAAQAVGKDDQAVLRLLRRASDGL